MTAAAAINNDAELNAFISAKARVDAALEKLTQASEDHFGTLPNDVDHRRVARLTVIAAQLENICKFMNV